MSTPQSTTELPSMLRLLHRAAAFMLLLGLSAIELALADRKFGILTGGFNASRVIEGTSEMALWLLLWVPAQITLIASIYLLVMFLMNRRWNGSACLIMAIGVTTSLMVGVLILKYEVLQYFGDAMTFDLFQRLGGNDLSQAVLYIAQEAALFIVPALLIVALIVWCLRWALRRDLPPASGRFRPPVFLIAGVAAMPILSASAMLVEDGFDDAKYISQRFVAPALLRGALNLVSDPDRDGYTLFTLNKDPAPFDGRIYPLALDSPANGVDEDGLCGDLPAPGSARTSQPPVPHLQFERYRHLVLVVLESTRSDVVGLRHNGIEVAPNLNRLVASGSHVAAYSHAGFTSPSLISLFVGSIDPPNTHHSIFSRLHNAGFEVSVFSGQPESFGDIDQRTLMRENAIRVVDAETLKNERALAFAAKGSLRVDEQIVVREFKRHLDRREVWDSKRQMVYLNFQAAHFPYNHIGMEASIEPNPLSRAEIRPQARERLIGTYLNAVAWSDRWLGEVLATLERLQVMQDTLVVVTADHGESLFDDGFLGHGHGITHAQLRIPFVISQPGVKMNPSMGLSEAKTLILRLLAGQQPDSTERPALLYLGELANAHRVGFGRASGRVQAVDLINRTYQSHANARWAPLEALSAEELADACEIVKQWGWERWNQHEERLTATR